MTTAIEGLSTRVLSSSRSRSQHARPWLHSARFDLLFFQLTGVLCLLLLVPYRYYGSAAVIPIYNFYLIFFGMPHNFLTWLVFLPRNVRAAYNLTLIKRSALVCFLICAALPWTAGHALESYILSLITYASLWHAYRQHHGILKIYDVIQARRSGDFSLLSDRKISNLFFGLALFAVVVWAFTHERLSFLLSADATYELAYPQLPIWLFYAYALVTLVIGLVGFKRCLWDRYRQGKVLPWVQCGVMAMAFATFVGPYFVVSLDDLAVAVAIGTMFHNIQYMAFVWLFERQRLVGLVHSAEGEAGLLRPQRWAYRGQWGRYFLLALGYSLAMITFYVLTPRPLGLSAIYFLAFSHYIIDGHIWQSRHNTHLGPAMARLTGGQA